MTSEKGRRHKIGRRWHGLAAAALRGCGTTAAYACAAQRAFRCDTVTHRLPSNRPRPTRRCVREMLQCVAREGAEVMVASHNQASIEQVQPGAGVSPFAHRVCAHPHEAVVLQAAGGVACPWSTLQAARLQLPCPVFAFFL